MEVFYGRINRPPGGRVSIDIRRKYWKWLSPSAREITRQWIAIIDEDDISAD